MKPHKRITDLWGPLKEGAFRVREFVAADTENYTDGRFRVGCLYDGNSFIVCNTRVAMQRELRKHRYRSKWIVFHNVGYDLCNTFGAEPGGDYSLVNRKVFFARLPITSRRETVTIVDSFRHYTASLEDIAEKLGMKKLFTDVDLDTISDEECLARCKQDCLVLYEFVTNLQKQYNELGTSFNTTIGASSIELYRRRFMPRVWWKKLALEKLEFLRSAYYGGRTEAIKLGPIEANSKLYDINSMYPSVMQDLELGIPDDRNAHITYNPQEWMIERPGASEVLIYVPDCLYGPIPKKDKEGRLTFPSGYIRTHVSHLELRYALNNGCKLIEHNACVYFDANIIPFKDFVTELYKVKLEGGWKALIAKLCLNNQYGKYGQSRPPVTLTSSQMFLEGRLNGEFNDEDAVIEYLKGHDSDETIAVLYRPRGRQYPKHANIHWAADITAAARLKLLSALVKYNGVYCDTDSIITTVDVPTSKDLGDWSLKETISRGYIYGPKEYEINTECTTKGVPKKKGYVEVEADTFIKVDKITEYYMNNRRVAYDAPMRLMEYYRKSSVPGWEREGELYKLVAAKMKSEPVLWYPHVKQKKGATRPRRVKQDTGWTLPIKVDDR